MVEELSERSALMRAPGLRSIYGIEGLIEEQTSRPRQVHPGRTVDVQRRIIPEHRNEIDDDEAEPSERDLVDHAG